MDFVIREAKEQDYEELLKIFDEGDLLHIKALPQIFKKVDEPSRSRDYISSIIGDENAGIFLAESGNQIIGFIVVVIREAPNIPIMVKRRFAYVDSIVVTEKSRDSGIGRALMAEAEQWALGKKASQLELNVWDFNQEAIEFFKKLGYKTSRRNMWKTV